MSSEIVYGLECIKFTAEETGGYETKYIMVGQCGSSNCYESRGGSCGRRSRDWTILATGGECQVMETMVKMAAGCEGGMVKMEGLRGGKWGCTPEQFIRACRKAIENAVHGFDGATERGLSFDLRIRLYESNEYTSPSDKRCADWTADELVKQRPMMQDQEYGCKFREFRFELAEVAEWFKWTSNRRSEWTNGQVRGPRDPKPVQRELALA